MREALVVSTARTPIDKASGAKSAAGLFEVL